MPMTEVQRRTFIERLDAAIDEAHAARRPLFDTVNGAGAYHLPSAEQKLLHEIMFKLGMLRGVLFMGTSLRRKFMLAGSMCKRWAPGCAARVDE
jgi:hypothetical protein